jgi:hypothetical protein
MLPWPIKSIDVYRWLRLSSLFVYFDWCSKLPRVIGCPVVPQVILLAKLL